MFNLILDSLPDSFRGARIKTDFKQGLKFHRIVEADYSDRTKAELMIDCLFNRVPSPDDDGSYSDLWDFFNWYLSGGKEESEREAGGSGQKTFDFNQDHGRLYAAFYQTYRINLRTVENLHWWTFLELFYALPDDTNLMKIIEIRGRDIPKKADPEYKRKLRKLKESVKIHSKESDEAQIVQLQDFFGGW